MTKWERRAPLEKSIEREGCNLAVKRGWIEYKVTSSTANGFPDRFYARDGVILLVEWKRPGEEPTKQQTIRHRELREHGVIVHWVCDIEHAHRIFD